VMVACRAVAELGAGLLIDRFGHQDLARLGSGLNARSGVDDGADGREVAMGMAELAEADLPRMDADADAELGAPRLKAPLHFARREHTPSHMIGIANREVADRHHGIADRLV